MFRYLYHVYPALFKSWNSTPHVFTRWSCGASRFFFLQYFFSCLFFLPSYFGLWIKAAKIYQFFIDADCWIWFGDTFLSWCKWAKVFFVYVWFINIIYGILLITKNRSKVFTEERKNVFKEKSKKYSETDRLFPAIFFELSIFVLLMFVESSRVWQTYIPAFDMKIFVSFQRKLPLVLCLLCSKTFYVFNESFAKKI